jgi:uridine kinase
MTSGNQLLLTPRHPVILGIAGCSGSGKTTLARELAGQLDATLLPLDFYYRDLAHLPAADRTQQNFDHPDSLESDLLTRQVATLANGQPIDCPIYDFATHTRLPGRTQRMLPTAVVIVEGILALHYESLRRLFTFSVYVEAPHDVCLTRRIHRDIRERGRTETSVRRQFERTTRPMADLYVVPSAAHADLTVEGTAALDWSVEQVLQQLNQRRLLH